MTTEGVLHSRNDNIQKFTVNVKLYTETAIFKTCYVFIDKNYIYLEYSDHDTVVVSIKPKNKGSIAPDLVDEFLNELINQRLRIDINRDTGKIREMLVAKSLFEGGLVDENTITIDNGSDDNYVADPKNIGDLKGIE